MIDNFSNITRITLQSVVWKYFKKKKHHKWKSFSFVFLANTNYYSENSLVNDGKNILISRKKKEKFRKEKRKKRTAMKVLYKKF